MKQFMEQIPDSLIEAAHIDGAGEYRIFWRIVMPNVRPAWLTVGFSPLSACGTARIPRISITRS